MVSLPVFNKSGDKVGSYDIDPDAIAPKISQQLLHDVVVMYQASARQGADPTGVPSSSPRTVSMTGVTGWCSAMPWSQVGMVSMGTNALDG